MSILYLLLPLTLILVTALVIIIVWAVQSGQFDDLDSPAHRILSDRDERNGESSEQKDR